ncbi:helix-turn-helix domain-containing protein [Rhodococcus sp. BL-253-APC-6A1W]|uniref:DUF2637 domain-containing protein n=1 Tax=Rhodococcus sp. BL-253-APC-6A1W TaxID=2725307 RepID=UPI00146A1F77|nr:DUF2637 domain-containing protein [Rhodococcus sp. BL-253-APC-6A1W]NMD95003.1 helix-turn-helix domain-containing protein [Rhodococcus sp. BL-253-APC-6A1W]
MQHRLSQGVAVAGTAAICAAAFILSFAALTDLAARSGVTVPWLWPAIVDGLILVATVAVVAGAGRYAWLLLLVGALVSVAGNVLHAALPDGPLPIWLRATVAAVPPVALVAVAHLAVVLRRATVGTAASEESPDGLDAGVASAPPRITDTIEVYTPSPTLIDDPDPEPDGTLSGGVSAEPVDPPNAAPEGATKTRALQLLHEGIEPRTVAHQLGVHRTTVYRWRREVALA